MYIYGMWPWKVPKWPWFWAEVAVKACRDLATLIGTLTLGTIKAKCHCPVVFAKRFLIRFKIMYFFAGFP
jgi:hypothetical protein